MARPKPDPDTVLPLIIDRAIQLIKVHGFENMTMKRLAQAADMSVGKLYHFFPGKDDLFLRLEIHYFDGVYQRIADSLADRDASDGDELNRFRGMLDAYYQFAVEHLELYKLVTSPPKVFAHYLDTRNEPLAQEELASALRAIAIFRKQYERALLEKRGQLEKRMVDELFLLFVNSVHGLILMSQSTAWPYIALGDNEAPDRELVKRLPSAASIVDIRRQIDLILEKLI
ncbi:MAG: hypothetical protein C9356_07485 [Oleiphilus sp.]|nr:MAG: hypothetical protein C9356_07485 [Oleiphilus sp.]